MEKKDIEQIKTKVRISLELSRKDKRIRISKNNLDILIKEINKIINEENKETIIDYVISLLKEYKAKGKIRMNIGRFNYLLQRIEFNINNPDYVRITDKKS